jgi:hypothetical protein
MVSARQKDEVHPLLYPMHEFMLSLFLILKLTLIASL